MNVQTAVDQNQEQTLIKIMRTLPPSRVEELLDFARFLEAQILTKRLIEEEDVAEIEADNDRWDALLSTDEAQTLLERLAEEALTEHRLAKTKPMIFSNEGRIMPG
ncbi:MAG: hypothetical protein H6R23_2102 [Proteobacteria bacterium]|jgi:molybdenum cofactor biosynthesis enzyme MoaA|nr:hypothetical protein [Pseudomonadota bacterium]